MQRTQSQDVPRNIKFAGKPGWLEPRPNPFLELADIHKKKESEADQKSSEDSEKERDFKQAKKKVKLEQDDETARMLLDEDELKDMTPQDKVIHHFKVKTMLHPKDGKSFIKLGASYCLKGLYNNAAEAYRKAVKLRPNDPKVYQHLGNTHYMAESYAEAIESYK